MDIIINGYGDGTFSIFIDDSSSRGTAEQLMKEFSDYPEICECLEIEMRLFKEKNINQ
jgi:hypothetical protein